MVLYFCEYTNFIVLYCVQQVQHEEVSSTSTSKDPSVELPAHIKAHQRRKYLLVNPGEYFDLEVMIKCII